MGLQALHVALTALPSAGRVSVTHPLQSPAPLEGAAARSLAVLTADTRAWLERLAEHIDAALLQAMGDVERRWDVFDSVPLVPVPLRVAGIDLRDAWRTRVNSDPRAATEALFTIEATLALVRSFERHLAALVRGQLLVQRKLRRDDEPQTVLLPQQRPFIDLSAALLEVARAWRP